MMFVDTLRESNINTVLPIALLLICVGIFLLKSKPTKKTRKVVKNDRIYSYRPEPMIDCSKVNAISNRFEISMPDEKEDNCLNLVKINYLNLLNNTDIQKQAETCIREYGVGSCGPRGFYGTIDVHLTLENRLAEFMDMEEAVLYSYGFSTISSAIGAYCKKSDILFCDEKIHFSTQQGMLAAKSKVVYFKHNDTEDLELKLKQYEEKEAQKKKLFRKFLFVEGIYSSTGAICPLPKLMELREKYKLRIFIDESISFGVLGENGKGVTEHFNIDRSNVDMIMGSLEGSLGSIGGFCVGASVVIEHQRLSGLGYCFSASLPPFLSYISLCALNLMESDSSIFKKLESISVLADKELRNLKNYIVISDPLSPLKVFTTKEEENRTETLKKLHSACTMNNIHLLRTEDSLSFNVNVALSDDSLRRIITTLMNAIHN